MTSHDIVHSSANDLPTIDHIDLSGRYDWPPHLQKLQPHLHERWIWHGASGLDDRIHLRTAGQGQNDSGKKDGFHRSRCITETALYGYCMTRKM